MKLKLPVPVRLFLLISLYAGVASAQGKDSIHRYNNAVFFELGGPNLVYSLGYERTWYQSQGFAVMTGAGFSYIPDGITLAYIEPGVLFRSKNVAFELGLAFGQYKERPHNGSRFNSTNGSAEHTFMAPRVGVRFFSRNQRLHYRLGITPNMELSNNDNTQSSSEHRLMFWLNVFTIGYRF